MQNTRDSKELPSSVVAIDHVAIAVDNIDETVAFFERILGFEVLERRITRGQSTSMLSAVLKVNGVVIVVVQGVEESSQVTRFVRAHGPGVQHLALSVTNLDALVQRLDAAGVNGDTPLLKNAGMSQVFLRKDKGSGVRLELIERTGGNFTDESVARLFREFEAKGLY